MDTRLLEGLSILVLEDEFLIALDIEETCIEQGAAEVTTCRSLDELGTEPLDRLVFDVAVIDMHLGGQSTLDFARSLFEAGRPFVFATGHSRPDEFGAGFPGVAVVTKPFQAQDLVEAIANAIRMRREGAVA